MKYWWFSLLFSVKLLLAATLAFAQSSEHFTEIEYDEAGRVKAVKTAVEEAAPSISSITPSIIRRGPAVNMEVTGSGLRGAAVTAGHPGLTVSAVTATATRVSFRLQAQESVPLGEHWLQFATVLGTAEVAVTVRPRLPVLRLDPNPVALAPGQTRTVALRIDSADVIDHTLVVASSAPALVTVAPNAVTIAAGTTEGDALTVQTAGTTGQAVLWVQAEEMQDLAVPVFVTPPYQPPPGGAKFYAPLLGVHLGEGPQPPSLISRGPFTALLGVWMAGKAPPGPTYVSPLLSPPLGVSRGPVAHALLPGHVVRGEGSTVVEVSGSGLDAVASAALWPADGVSVALQSVDGDGGRVLLDVAADAAAALGVRELRLSTAGGAAVPFGSPLAARLRVVEPAPTLTSVAPQLLVQGTPDVAVTLRGERLGGVGAVRLTPAEGIVVDAAPVVSEAGTRIDLRLAIAADAPLGTRVVSVASAAGESSTNASAANSVQVVEALGPRVTPVLSPLLGVTLGDAGGGGFQQRSMASSLLGVSVGRSFSALDPPAEAVDSQFLLQVEGHGLEGVNALVFEPAAGIAVGALEVSGDGRRVGTEVAIDADAARGLRRLRLFGDSGEILPARAEVALFGVTDRLPEIDSVAPVLLVPGAGPVSLEATGRRFGDATALRLLPPEGVVASPVVVGEGGTRLRSDVSIAADAALGPRVVVIDAPTGSSSEVASVANTVHLVSGLGSPVTPVVAPLLGVRLGPDTAGDRRVDLLAPLLGVYVESVPEPSMRTLLLPAPALGVALGPVATGFTPRYLPVGQAANLRVEGIALSAVHALQFEPDEGIDHDGDFEVAPDGRVLTLSIEVASDAPQTARRLVLRDAAANELQFALPAQAIARVVGNEPRIDSISPIQVLPSQTLALTIRGGSLFGASAVTATPATGLTFSVNPSVNADGTEVTVGLTVAADAPAGPRVIRVVASGGVTTGEAVPANTLTVVTGQ